MITHGTLHPVIMRVLPVMLAVSAVLALVSLVAPIPINAEYCLSDTRCFGGWIYECENCLLYGQWTGWYCWPLYPGMCA